jgi:cyclohexanecarboxylate-CoA ligase
MGTTDIEDRAEAWRAKHFRAKGWWRDQLPIDDLDNFADITPNKTAIVGYRIEAAERVALTYRQFADQSVCLAIALRRMGVRPGDVVSFQVPNWWEFPVITMACWRIGAITNPILPILREREVQFILECTQPSVVIVAGDYRGFSYAQMISTVAKRLSFDSAKILVIGADAASGSGLSSFHAAYSHMAVSEHDLKELRALRPDPDADAQIMYTSGTTGEPKGVVHTHNTLYAGARAMSDTYRLHTEDVVYMVSPLAHQTGFLHAAVSPFLRGMTAVYQDVWSPKEMLRIVRAEGATWTMMGASAFLNDLISEARTSDVRVPSLRTLVTGGEPIPAQLIVDAQEALGTELHTVWGMTECAAAALTKPGDGLDTRSESDGAPWEGVELRIADRSTGEPVSAGTEGSLLVRGATLAVDYFKRPDLYQASRRQDGWFETGDLARLRPDGYIRITGRSKEMVIRGGENIPVVEIERILFDHPSVADVVVVGLPDPRLGERACAVVVARGVAPRLEELVEYLERRGVARAFWPESTAALEALPRTASGKIERHKVRTFVEGLVSNGF